MTMLCKVLDYAECPIPLAGCADVCSLDSKCPISLTECEQQCSDTRCSAIEEDCS